MNRHQRNQIRARVEPVLAAMELDLVAVEMTSDGRSALLRLSVDREGGVGIRECVRATRKISELFEEADPISGAYRLEVSSPGIERPVERVEDFARFAGLKCKFRLVEGAPKRRFTAVLDGVEEGHRIRVRDLGEAWSVDIDDVERAHLVLDLEEFERLRPVANHAEERADDHERS